MSRREASGRPSRVVLGRLGRPHGIRGELRFFPEDPTSELIGELERVSVGERGAHVLRRARRSGRFWILSFEGLDDRGRAEALVGEPLWVERAALPPLEEGHYLFDLLGCEAVSPGGERLGLLASVEVGAPVDFLVLEHPGGRCLVPAVGAFLASVDLSARRVVLDLPEGFLEAQQG